MPQLDRPTGRARGEANEEVVKGLRGLRVVIYEKRPLRRGIDFREFQGVYDCRLLLGLLKVISADSSSSFIPSLCSSGPGSLQFG